MLHNQCINTTILHFSGQPEMRLRTDGAMSNHGITHGSIQLLFRLKVKILISVTK